MSSRKKRTSELNKVPLIAALDHRHRLNEKGEDDFFSQLPRNERRQLKKEGKKIGGEYKKILDKLFASGANFPNDQLLRQMAREYTHRYASSGLFNQPANFNYFEPFCKVKLIPNSSAPYIEIPKEYDHLFYSSDFFDYITSPESDDFDLESLLELPDKKVFHFTTNGDVKDISFLNSENREFLISGFSMVRHGNYLHWYLLGGEVLSDEEWESRCSTSSVEFDMKDINPSKKAFLSDSMKDCSGLGEPLPLVGTETAIRTIVCGEMDLLEKKHLSRCYMSEYENSFPFVCDDPEVLDGMGGSRQRDDFLKDMVEQIERASVLWRLAEGLFQLPSYFSSRVPIEKEVISKSGKRLSRKKGGSGLGKEYKIISSIEVMEFKPKQAIVKANMPHYEVETEGHWRRLPSDGVGRDRNGDKVIGKTWVKSSNPWKEAVNVPRTVFVKDSIASAKLEISEYIEAAAKFENKEVALNTNYGELYVMRCPAMKDRIFKVGFTTGDSAERAKQLSSATGIPLSFVVVKVWKHPDAAGLETEVHMMLSPYRLNNGREFFRAKFNVIEEIIEVAINKKA